MSDETVILTFEDLPSYRRYKEVVASSGGRIKHDLGETLLGFTAVMPPTAALLQLMRSSGSNDLVNSGITSFEFDSKVTIQAQ